MIAYAIFDVEIHNPDCNKDFMDQEKPALEAAGVRYLSQAYPGGKKLHLHPTYSTPVMGWKELRLLTWRRTATFATEYSSS
jgi:uncharacterized protein (DUF1330 family)